MRSIVLASVSLSQLGFVCAGVIFFAGNYASRSQFSAAVKKLIAANASTSNPARAYPLLLMTDQEGGEVRRLPGQPVLSEKEIGESKHPASEAGVAGSGAGLHV